MPNEDLVRVWSAPSIPEGEIARSRLEDEGIPVLVKGEGEGPYRMGPVHLYVPAALEVQARMVLDVPMQPVTDDELAALAEEAGEEP